MILGSIEGWKSKSNSSRVLRNGKWAKRSRAARRRARVASTSALSRLAKNSSGSASFFFAASASSANTSALRTSLR